MSKEPTRKLFSIIQSTAKPENQASLQSWLPKTIDPWIQTRTTLKIPRNINWDILPRIYEFHPENYEELLSIQRVGPAIVQGLALVVELVYDEEPSWEDHVRFSFAYGDKDGEPYPVDHKARDQSIEILRESVQEARIGTKEKTQSYIG